MLKLFIIGIAASLAARIGTAEATVKFRNENLTVAEDKTGRLYAFEGYRFDINKKVVLLLDNNGTADKEDDLIVTVIRKEE